MIPICEACGAWIEHDNRHWPGYCSPVCRSAAAQEVATRRDRQGARHGEVAE